MRRPSRFRTRRHGASRASWKATARPSTRFYDELLPVAWRLATARCRERAAAEALARVVLAHDFRHLGDRPSDRPLAGWLADLIGPVAARRRAPPPETASSPIGA